VADPRRPEFLPTKEEIKERIKQLALLRSSGLSPKIIESVMYHNVPTFEEVIEVISTTRIEEAEEILMEKIQGE